MDKGRIVKIQYTAYPPAKMDKDGIVRPEARDFTWQVGGKIGELIIDEITYDFVYEQYWLYVKVRNPHPDANGNYEKKTWLSITNPSNLRVFHDYDPLLHEEKY